MPMLETASFITESGTLVLSLTIDDAADLAEGPVQVQLMHHDDVDVAWWSSPSCARIANAWESRIGLDPSDQQRLFQIARAQDAAGTPIDLAAAFLFLEPTSDGEWTTGAAAEAERVRLEQARTVRYDVPIIDPNAVAADPTFAVVMLVDNLLLTINQRVPGIRVMSLTNTTLGADIATVLNATLPQVGFRGGVDPGRWLEMMQNRRPSVIVYAPKVQSAQPQTAVDHCRRRVHQLLDLFALRRGATPRLLGGVVGDVDAAGQPQFAGFWIEGGNYRGNLLGGFVSGEDQHGLLLHWDGMAQDPRVRLWLSLYADAIADDRWDYVLFRCFNLLEGIGGELLPRNAPILDDQGSPRMQANGDPYTTNHARGKVYELCRVVAVRMNQGVGVNLWDDVGTWVKVRNQVAHRGGWALPEGEVPTQEHATVEAQIIAGGHDGTFDSGVSATIREAREAVKSALYAGLLGRL